MKAFATIAKKLPKGSLARVVVEAAVKGVDENERRFERERSEFERKRDERRRQWAERHQSNS